MRALTLWRPWPFALFDSRLDKGVENRTWWPPRGMLGRWIAIHAGSRWDRDGWPALQHLLPENLGGPADHPSMSIVGVALLARATDRERDVPERWRRWWAGPVGWVLPKRVALPRPIFCPGARGLWMVPPEIEAEIRAQLRTVHEARAFITAAE